MSDAFPAAPLEEALAALRADPASGLAQAEATRRLAEHGYNEVPEKHAHPLLAFLGKFWGLSAWMLELIMLLSLLLGKYSDLAVVGALLVVNAVLGYAQERRAAGVVETLRRRLQVSARVLREGAWRAIPARELVPGDIVRLRTGDIVPADVRLLGAGLTIDQSALTGESAEARKARGDVLPSGSLVRRGEGNALVALTGAKTYFGRTTELVQLARPRLHVEAVIARLVRWLLAIVGALVAAVAAVALARGAPLAEMALLMLVLLMSAIPVALPVMFTVSMALGSAELAKRGVLVTRLSAAEDAATMDVLCVDKTGTLTMNRLTVTGVIPLGGAAEKEVLLAGALASREANQDPIDLAFLAAAGERSLRADLTAFKPSSFMPFDATTRRTEALVERDGRRLRVVKGAVRTVAALCGLEAEPLEARLAEYARKGYRALAVARGPESGKLDLIGLVTLYDAPRPDAARLVGRLRDLGVRVKMLTGDALAVAQEIGHSIGLRDICKATDAGAATADGLAEIYPEDKYRIVRELQAAGHVAGMTGDGVNDAPALRQAEVGIAVSDATDIAKGAASVVLTEPGLANIVALVEQGRVIYQRVLTWVVNKVSTTLFKAAFVAVAFAYTGRFVISAFAMLLVVFMTDFAKIALATDRVRASPKPETWNIGGLVFASAALGVAMVLEALLLLYLAWRPFGIGRDDAALATFSFATLLYFSVFSILSARERRPFWASRPSRALGAALAADTAAGTAIALLGMPGLAPLPWPQVAGIFAYAMIVCLLVNDALKVAMLRRGRIP